MRLLSLILCLTAYLAVFASDPDPVPLYNEETDGGTNPEVGPRRRTPPAPVICFIDFEQGTITGSAPVLDTVSYYQLMDAEGSVTIASSPLAAEL